MIQRARERETETERERERERERGGKVWKVDEETVINEKKYINIVHS